MLASVARACSAGPMHLHVRWASTAADRVASSEQSKWAAILDPLYLHPSSPMAHSVDSAQHPLAATPRPTFRNEDTGTPFHPGRPAVYFLTSFVTSPLYSAKK